MIWFSRVALIATALFGVLAVTLTLAWNLRVPLSSGNEAFAVFDDPARISRSIRKALLANELTPPAVDAALARRAAEFDPLGDYVYVLAALESRDQGRLNEGIKFLEIARKRDPRNRVTRILLADGYAREARAGEFAQEALALEQLRARTAEVFVPMLAELARSRQTSLATIEELRGTKLGLQVLQALARDTAAPELLLAFEYQPIQGGIVAAEDRKIIDALVQPYLSARQWDNATFLWRRYYGVLDANLPLVIENDFKGKVGPPLGWRLGRSGGIAELNDRGLEIVHYGRTRWVIVAQTIFLLPGGYRFGFETEEDQVDLSELKWSIRCLEDGELLFERPMGRGFFDLEPQNKFAVPSEGCYAQSLELIGEPSNGAGSSSLVIGSVAIQLEDE